MQPNVDCYEEKFSDNVAWQMQNISDLFSSVPRDSRVVVLPETALPERLNDDKPLQGMNIMTLQECADKQCTDAMVVTGASTIKFYPKGVAPSETARRGDGYYYDFYNSAVAVNSDSDSNLHHKMRLVIGVETMPFTKFLNNFVDLGGITGQLGRNDKATVFEKGNVKFGPAICYEGIYGDCFARFAREGAEAMLVMSNDGWWGNTLGYRYLFKFCRLRAIEVRRDVARSANTGVSGFITMQGEDIERMEWDNRGVLTADIRLNNKQTVYAKYGDYIGRLSLYIALLCLLYFVAFLAKKKFYLN